MGYLISETTREEREQIVREALGNIDGQCDGCMSSLADMYQDYIDGKREIRDINMSFNARYVSYDYEITKEIYDKLGTFSDDYKNEELIRTGNMSYSFENTMYGTLGLERKVWDEEAIDAMQECIRKEENE